MIKQNKIEFVCTANHGRSPVAALMANNYLKEIGADKEYSTISSGHYVDAIKEGNVSIDFMLHVVGLAQERCKSHGFDESGLINNAMAYANDGVLDPLKELY